MLALELYREENGYPDDFIVIIEGSYDYDDYKKATLKSRDVYNGKRYESVCVVEMSKDAHKDFLKAKYGEDEDYGLYEWEEEHSGDIITLFASDCESIPEEVYFRWWRADNDIDGAIFYYEHSTGNKIEDGYSIQIGEDLYGDYWFAVAEENEDRIEDLQSFHNANGRDIHKWQEWYKKEWIIDVTRQEIERLRKTEHKGYKWVLKA